MSEASTLIEHFFSSYVLLSLVVSLACIPLLRRLAVKIDLIDHPGGRKQHKNSVPLAGGAAIFSSITICALVFGLPKSYEGFAIAVCGLFLIGFLDDKYDISARLRLIIQTALVIFALWLDNNWVSQIAFTSEISLQLHQFQYLFSVILILGIINAVNMLDGLDGLSSGVVLIILGFMIGLSSISAGTEGISAISLVIFGAVLGFWAFNYRFSWRERASVFMGDSGTIVLGFALPYLAIKLVNVAPQSSPESLMLWLFALPIWDICAVIIKRMRDGKSPLKAGRDHIHHVLMASGLTVRHSLHLIYLLTLASISFGVALNHFMLTKLESYVAFIICMGFYLARVGSLYRKPQSETYNYEKYGDRRQTNISTIIPIEKKSKTLS